MRQPKDAPATTGSASGIVPGMMAVKAAAIPTVICAFAIICPYYLPFPNILFMYSILSAAIFFVVGALST